MGLILQSSSSIKRLFLLLGTATLLSFACLPSATCSVSYDDRAVIINGQRRILMSGSIHYPRSTPEMWPDLIQKAKDGGIDVIQTYVFWNGHEPSPGKFFFEGRYDLVKFINLVKAAGLYVHLRIGPYVCAEWNFGGFPVWLKFVPGISFRTDNEPFKAAMAKFTKMIVDMMKFEKLFEPQGGPIILSQIENEYGPIEWEIGAPGKAFTQWAAKMAVDLATDVPWVMCKQDEVPDPIINTCNGYYCHDFEPNKKYKPKMFTENWTGWFTGFGGPVPYRPAEDTAYSVAMFVMKGGSFVNYYMYHGGTNFGRTAGGPLLVTSYDYDAPLDEYGLLRQPKWGHLTNLHKAIKTCEPALVSGDPIVTSLGAQLEAYVYKSNTGACAAFLANNDPAAAADVVFQGLKYNLPAWSVSILPDCKTSIYNTAKVEAQISQIGMTSVSSGFTWTKFNDDPLPFEDKESFTAQNLIEQINATWDNTDYLWYSTDVMIDQGEGFLKNGQFPVLNVTSAGHALQVFINGEASGTGYGNVDNPKISFWNKVKLKAGNNKISILSGAVGLPNVGLHFETWNYGVLGPVTLDGLNEGKRDLSLQKWTYRAGLKGEKLELFTLKGSSAVQWGPAVVKNQPLTWYKTTFDAPVGNDPLALDMSSMGKGLIWINGQGIGRHWPANKAFGNCGGCSYNGPYNEKKCLANCGDSTQKWYHVPRSWLFPKGNLLVVLEEWGGDPAGISLVKRTMTSACAYVPDSSPMINLSCSPGQKFSSIKFASFGTPSGVCGSYKEGSCHAIKSYDIFQKNCIGQQSCSVSVTPVNFGGNPCPNVPKAVAVEALCQ